MTKISSATENNMPVRERRARKLINKHKYYILQHHTINLKNDTSALKIHHMIRLFIEISKKLTNIILTRVITQHSSNLISE